MNAGVEGAALKAAAREWALVKGLRADIVELPYASLFEKELLDLNSRTGAYDVIMIDDPWFPRLAQKGNLAPLPQPLDSDFLPSCALVCREPYRNGREYALPYVGNSQLFFYRKDLFEKHGFKEPDTWNTVLAAARKIAGAERVYGYVMRAAQGNPVVADFMPLLWAYGGDLLNEAGEPVINSKEAAEALQMMIDLGKVSPPGYTGFNADEVAAHLLQATAAMSINWPAWISAMDDPQRSKVAGQIEFRTVPSARAQGVGELGVWLLAVPAASRNQALAFEFLSWATDAVQMKKAALRGNPPTRRSLFQDADLRKSFRAYPAQLASLESARPRPRTPLWNEIENALGIALSEANTGSVTPEQALAQAQKEIAAIVARAK